MTGEHPARHKQVTARARDMVLEDPDAIRRTAWAGLY
jgi:hypothetical protein